MRVLNVIEVFPVGVLKIINFNFRFYKWILFVLFNTLRPRQNGRQFADDIFECFFLNEDVWISIKISLMYLPTVPINNIPALIQIMAWPDQATSYYLNQWRLFYWRIYASLGLNELNEMYFLKMVSNWTRIIFPKNGWYTNGVFFDIWNIANHINISKVYFSLFEMWSVKVTSIIFCRCCAEFTNDHRDHMHATTTKNDHQSNEWSPWVTACARYVSTGKSIQACVHSNHNRQILSR